MGWCSGTKIFDVVVGALLDKKIKYDGGKEEAIESLIVVLEDHDWDCQGDSEYFDHPKVKPIFKKLHPHWYKEDDVPQKGK